MFVYDKKLFPFLCACANVTLELKIKDSSQYHKKKKKKPLRAIPKLLQILNHFWIYQGILRKFLTVKSNDNSGILNVTDMVNFLLDRREGSWLFPFNPGLLAALVVVADGCNCSSYYYL